MREDFEHEDDAEGFSSEIGIYVVFADGGSSKRAFGPYRTAQVTENGIWVFEGAIPIRIASKKENGAWEIPDGSDQPATFRHVLMLCSPRGVTAAQLEERLSPRMR